MKAKKYFFKKRLWSLSATLLLGGVFAFSAPVEFGVGNNDDPDPTLPLPGKCPITIPSVDLNGYELTFQSMHPEYALDIVLNGIVVYSVNVSETTTTVILPSWLCGEYELQLYPEDCSYYFYGNITL